jgi:hypothetical protein
MTPVAEHFNKHLHEAIRYAESKGLIVTPEHGVDRRSTALAGTGQVPQDGVW